MKIKTIFLSINLLFAVNLFAQHEHHQMENSSTSKEQIMDTMKMPGEMEMKIEMSNDLSCFWAERKAHKMRG